MIDLSSCSHDGAYFVQESRGTPLGDSSPAPDRHTITVCPHCGQFEILAHKDGVFIRVRFRLARGDLVRAAGKYLKWLDMERDREYSSGLPKIASKHQ